MRFLAVIIAIVFAAEFAHAKAPGFASLAFKACLTFFETLGSGSVNKVATSSIGVDARYIPIEIKIREPSHLVSLESAVKARREQWRMQHPGSPENFAMPEFSRVMADIRKRLSLIKTPAIDRESAEYVLKEIDRVEQAGFPYRDSLNVAYKATTVFRSKYQAPLDLLDIKRFLDLVPKNLESEALAQIDKIRTPSLAAAMRRNALVNDALKDYKAFLKTKAGNEHILENPDTAALLERFRDKSFEELLVDEDFMTNSPLGFFVNAAKPKVGRDAVERATIQLPPSSTESVLLPTAENLSLETIAESYLARVEPIGITGPAKFVNGRWTSSVQLMERDLRHRKLTGVAKRIFELPMEMRTRMIAEIGSVSDSRSSAMLSLVYEVMHEGFAAGKSVLTSPEISQADLEKLAKILVALKGNHRPLHNFGTKDAEQAILWLRRYARD